MGGGGGFLGLGGGGGSPDTSAYDRQLAEQRAETARKEQEAAKLKAEQDAAEKRRASQASSLIGTSPSGDEDETSVKRKTLLGGN